MDHNQKIKHGLKSLVPLAKNLQSYALQGLCFNCLLPEMTNIKKLKIQFFSIYKTTYKKFHIYIEDNFQNFSIDLAGDFFLHGLYCLV